MLRPTLDECDRTGMPAYLESSKEANLAFYARHGFEVTGRIVLGRNRSGPPMWTMWREPAADAADVSPAALANGR